PPREHTGVPGCEPQVVEWVSRADMATWRGVVHAFLAAEAMPLALLPGDGLPGRHQALAIRCCGASPRTHLVTFQHPGPTSAYPGRSSRRGLLRASFSPAVDGGPRRGEGT